MHDETSVYPDSLMKCLQFIAQELWPYIFGHPLDIVPSKQHEDGKRDMYLVDADYLLI